MTDFDLIYPHRAQFLRELSAVVAQRRLIEADANLTDDAKRKKIRQLTVGDSNTNIDDIGCVFCLWYKFGLTVPLNQTKSGIYLTKRNRNITEP